MVLNIYKPKGITSFGVVKIIRKIISEKKVGHAGTLDPFAEGVLIVGTGKDTKKLNNIINNDKTYTATIKLGKTTDTLDPEGVVTEIKKIPKINDSKINKILDSFLGTSMQTPPMFSAKKIGGVKLYELARKNIIIDREQNQINISNINLINFHETKITFSVSCSKGTYIRVLAKEIAEKLGTVGYLDSLVRTRVGEYFIDDSVSLDQFKLSWKSYAH